MGEQNNMNGKDFLIGMLVGSIIGASVAFLMAPKAGRELRQDISEGYETVSKKTQELARQVGEYSEILVDRVKEAAQQMKQNSEGLARTAAYHAVDYVDEGTKAPVTEEDETLRAQVDEVAKEVEEVKRRLEKEE